MAIVEWALICERVEYDPRGYANLMCVLAEIPVLAVPGRISLTLVARIRSTVETEVMFDVQISGPKGALGVWPLSRPMSSGPNGS